MKRGKWKVLEEPLTRRKMGRGMLGQKNLMKRIRLTHKFTLKVTRVPCYIGQRVSVSQSQVTLQRNEIPTVYLKKRRGLTHLTGIHEFGSLEVLVLRVGSQVRIDT